LQSFGLLDVIVFSYLADYTKTLQQNDHKSEIQFLLNGGQGKFTDVTDTYRVNYDVRGGMGYYPQVFDFNLDGLPDIFSSAPDWMPSYNSTTLLLQQQNGIFVDSSRDLFRTNVVTNNLSQSIITTGPNGNQFLVSEGKWDWSNPVTKVYLQSLSFPERDQSETLTGTDLDNRIYGLGGNDQLIGKKGNDFLDGGSGIDTAAYHGKRTEYSVTLDQGNSRVTDSVFSRDGADAHTNIERLKFSDTNVALDIGPTQNAGSVYMLYKAAFNRAPDAGGMGYWLAQVDGGKNIVTDIAAGFIKAPEFTAKYGANPTNAFYVDQLYKNVLGRTGEPGGVTYWNQQLDKGASTKAYVLQQFATLPEGASLVANLVANGIVYQEWVG